MTSRLQARIMPTLRRLSHATGLSTYLVRRSRRARIIMYHGVVADLAAAFAAQIAYLASRFRIVPLDALVEKVRAGSLSREVALTFDDGLCNNYTVVYPILRRLGIPATYFVCPGLVASGRWLWNHEARERLRRLDRDDRVALASALGSPAGGETETIIEWMKTLTQRARVAAENIIRNATPDFEATPREREQFDMMSWDQLASLDPALITIGAHTMSHPILTTLDRFEARSEIVRSRQWLEGRLGRRVDHFSYPNGSHDAAIRACVADTYRSAVSAEPGAAVPGDDLYRLPRIPAADDIALLTWRMIRPMA